jgi:para-nitrobenzyl esterase
MRRVLVVACILVVAAGCVPTSGRYVQDVFPSVSVTRDVIYGQATDEQGNLENLLLDLYQPVGDTLPARPAIIWVHGGSFTGGTKSNPGIVDLAETFAKQGYVTVSISYRLRDDQEPFTVDDLTNPIFLQAVTDARHDAQAAVRWLRANATGHRIDPDRIAIGGRSAGAITALGVGYRADDAGNSGNPGFPSHVAAAVSLAGAASPDAIGPGDAPAVVFHGTADRTVPYSFAQATCSTAIERGLVCELHAYEGVLHDVFSARRDDVIAKTESFLYRMLRLVELAGVPESQVDCKDGGWQNFSDDQGQPFKNQGQCVSWVVTSR